MITKEQKVEISGPFQATEKDTGNTAVQVALLTARINDLSQHLAENKKDHSSRRGLLSMVGQRRRLLNYLKKIDIQKYQDVLSKLNLRK